MSKKRKADAAVSIHWNEVLRLVQHFTEKLPAEDIAQYDIDLLESAAHDLQWRLDRYTEPKQSEEELAKHNCPDESVSLGQLRRETTKKS